MSNNDNTYTYSIKRVKDILFFVNERLYIQDPQKPIKIGLGQTIGYNSDKNLVNFTLRIYLHYPDSPGEILVEIQVENIFEVVGLKAFTDSNSFPAEILISIISISLSHARALLSRNISGTVFQEFILPITNPLDVAVHFFPSLFQQADIKQDAPE